MDQLVASAFLLLCPMTGVFHLDLKESELTTVQGILALMEEPGLGTDLLMAQQPAICRQRLGTPVCGAHGPRPTPKSSA